jgi:hypothetical protein
MARTREFKSEVWGHFLLLLSPGSNTAGDRARCRRCGEVLTAGPSNGTSHLQRHLKSTKCLQKQAAAPQPADNHHKLAAAADYYDAMNLLLQEDNSADEQVAAVQWRQGRDMMLLLRRRPQNLQQLQQQGFQVLLWQDLEPRLQGLVHELRCLVQQHAVDASAADRWPDGAGPPGGPRHDEERAAA